MKRQRQDEVIPWLVLYEIRQLRSTEKIKLETSRFYNGIDCIVQNYIFLRQIDLIHR